ncbi:hypothetical protein ES288_D04G012200v1 [Gossypium darwinii]|uniref:Uncharacterized protein n=1 Tax=Gossypium darwinii TaxID=34276 RepID=A0A5D2CWD4_GOSDA|nr:hypothetical protein ES288_D04G012200v1 [Gossypium darwinii]
MVVTSCSLDLAIESSKECYNHDSLKNILNSYESLGTCLTKLPFKRFGATSFRLQQFHPSRIHGEGDTKKLRWGQSKRKHRPSQELLTGGGPLQVGQQKILKSLVKGR